MGVGVGFGRYTGLKVKKLSIYYMEKHVEGDLQFICDGHFLKELDCFMSFPQEAVVFL
jgi:hypothetical protein